ncbi:hypothetical protein GCM10022384_57120 [Streptomyces marokkonensis]|uniref:Uncharacterized protein n=1 Tax=Streptomyces marokkonensis TaxID=324855 RepID=A0ABP7RW50_9ACTN
MGTAFYFDSQSVAHLRTGDLRDMAIGTGYVRVDGETGECRMLGATESAQLDLFRPTEKPGRWLRHRHAHPPVKQCHTSAGKPT